MKIVRWVLGRIILVAEFVMTPKGVQREEGLQQKMDAETSQYKMYQYEACPFCVKVRHAMKKQNIKMEFINAKLEKHRTELLAFGGEIKVPCLRMPSENGEDTWLYDSDNIIQFLNERAEKNDAVAATA